MPHVTPERPVTSRVPVGSRKAVVVGRKPAIGRIGPLARCLGPDTSVLCDT